MDNNVAYVATELEVEAESTPREVRTAREASSAAMLEAKAWRES